MKTGPGKYGIPLAWLFALLLVYIVLVKSGIVPAFISTDLAGIFLVVLVGGMFLTCWLDTKHSDAEFKRMLDEYRAKDRPQIIGKWLYQNNFETATIWFKSDGSVTWEVVENEGKERKRTVNHGTYEIEGSVLRVLDERGKPAPFMNNNTGCVAIEVNGAALTIVDFVDHKAAGQLNKVADQYILE